MKTPINKLTIHPLISDLPMLAEDSSDFQNLIASVLALGLDNEPLKVVGIQVIDGRHRLAAARLAGLTDIPVIQCDPDQAEEIILNSLISRRHLTKGALAYTSFPVLVAMHQGPGRKPSTESTVTDAADLSERLGFSRDLFFQAQALHKIYAEQPDYKALTEQRVMSGEIGLGAAIAGAAGRKATKNLSKGKVIYLAIAANGKLVGTLPTALTSLKEGFTRWDKLDTTAQAKFVDSFAEVLTFLPENARAKLQEVL